MSTKLTIFVCGTFRDLTRERKEILESIRKLQYQHDSMEYFGARNNRAIDTCLEEVRKSDVLVVLIGHSYGNLVPELEISYSEAEYQEGRLYRKPCLVYMIHEKAKVLPKNVETDPIKRELLTKFKETLSRNHTVKYFNSHDLAVSVTADLSLLAQEIERATITDPKRQIEILKQGTEVWNIWRATNPSIRPNLSKSNLRKMNLKGVNFARTNLSRVDLEEANLSNVNLMEQI